MSGFENFTVEAEALDLSGAYRSKTAQGKTFIEARKGGHDGIGEASMQFGASAGTYDLTLNVFDENDGQSTVDVIVNGIVVATVSFDEDTGSNYIKKSDRSITITDIELEDGDEIVFRGTSNKGEFARIDSIAFEQTALPAPVSLLEDDAFFGDEDNTIIGNVLANDANPGTLTVDSLSIGAVGDTIELEDGLGSITVNADGSFSLTPGEGAQSLKDGESADVSFEYTVQTGTTTETQIQSVTHTIDFDTADTATIVIGDHDDDDDDDDDNDDAEDNATAIISGALSEGDVVTRIGGVSISVDAEGSGRKYDEAMIFDTANPTGGDWDLATDTQGNALIISEDGDSNDPDDNEKGGDISFTFDTPSDVTSLTFIDLEDDATIRYYDANGALIGSEVVDAIGPNTVEAVSLSGSAVTTMVVTLEGSGALDDLVYVAYEEVEVEVPVLETATATITINGETDLGEAVADTALTDEDTSVSGNVLLNDVEGDDALSVAAIVGGTIGVPFDITSAYGRVVSIVLNADGSYIATPVSGFDDLDAGSSDTFSVTYELQGDDDGPAPSATLTITVTGVTDDLPPSVSAKSLQTDEDTAVSSNIMSDAVDPEGGPVTLTGASIVAPNGATTALTLGTATVITTAQGYSGTVLLTEAGELTFTPGADADLMTARDTDTLELTFTVTDVYGNVVEQTATVTIAGVNDNPDLVANEYTIGQATATEANILQGNVLSDDSDVDSPSIEVVGFAGVGVGEVATLSISAPNGGTYTAEVTMDAAGNFTFTQIETIGIALGETEYFTFDYQVSDGEGGLSTTTVTIGVDGANENPTANDDLNFVTNEENQLISNFLANDTDGDFNDVLTVSGMSVGGGTQMSFVTDGGRNVEVTINPDGTFLFVPGETFQELNLGESDQFSFQYQVTDGKGGIDTATATIRIEGLDEPVVAPETQDVINMIFIVDNSVSMHETYDNDPMQALFARRFRQPDYIDNRGNDDGTNQIIDMAIKFVDGLTQAVSDNRDFIQPDFVEDNQIYIDQNGVEHRIDATGLTPEERGGTIVNSAVFGMTDLGYAANPHTPWDGTGTTDWWNVYEADDTSLLPEMAEAFKDPGGVDSDFGMALQQVYDYLSTVPQARQTKIYFISDGDSDFTSDHAAIADAIEADYGASIEAIALARNDEFNLIGVSAADLVDTALTNGFFSDLNEIDTAEPGDTMDIVRQFSELDLLEHAEDAELIFDPTTTGPTIFDENGYLLPEYEYLMIL